MEKAYEKVKYFHETFAPWSLPKDQMPRMLERLRVLERKKFLVEEIDEFEEADNITDQADAMVDLIYFALGTLVEMGIEAEELFDIVHDANMAKVWEDGEVHLNEDNKVIKPPDWKDPEDELSKAIEGQAYRRKLLSQSFKVKGNHFVTNYKRPHL